MQDTWASRNMSRNHVMTPQVLLVDYVDLPSCFPLQLDMSWAVLRIRDVYPGFWIPDPDFYPSQIPDPGSNYSNKGEGWKKNWCHTFFVATNFTKLKIILFLKCWRKKFGPIFKELLKNYRTFTKTTVTKLSKIWVWNPETGIRDPEKTYFGSRIQGSKRHKIPDSGSRIQSRNTGCEGKKLTHLVSWFVSLLDMLWRTRFSVSLVSSSIFSWNSREQSILVWNFSVFICRRFQMLLKFVCPGRWKARPNIFIAIKINQSS